MHVEKLLLAVFAASTCISAGQKRIHRNDLFYVLAFNLTLQNPEESETSFLFSIHRATAQEHVNMSSSATPEALERR